MEQLPVELIEKILTSNILGDRDVINASLTSKHFYNLIADNNTIWKSKFCQHFPGLWNKLEQKPISYYNELIHVYLLRQQTRRILEDMAQKFYKKVELAAEDLREWENIIHEKLNNYFYLVLDLMDIISAKCDVVTNELIPLNTPGNLTQKFYAAKVLRFIRQIYLSRIWQLYISKPLQHRLLEEGAAILAQWCQPNVEIDLEDIHEGLDKLADIVKNELKTVCPNHPLFKATKSQFELWKLEIRPDNEWSPKDCRVLICTINEVLFRQLRFMSYSGREAPFNTVEEVDHFINVVLKTRKGRSEILAIIYAAVARRLGLRCEPIIFPSHFLLRFCESQHPDADWYYIDVANGGKTVKTGSCPFSKGYTRRGGAPKLPVNPPEHSFVKIAKDLENLASLSYSPSGRVTKLRSILELTQLINPRDTGALIDLATLYMRHNFNLGALKTNLLSNPDAQNIANILRDYRPDPPDDIIEPVRRPPDRISTIKFAIGMVMHHKLYGYKCVIFNWDRRCMAAPDWMWRNNISSLKYRDNQPFYNVLVEDNSHRYVAQENLNPISEPQGLRLNDEVGRYFSHYYQTYYVPNAQSEYHFPEDGTVREHYQRILKDNHPQVYSFK